MRELGQGVKDFKKGMKDSEAIMETNNEAIYLMKPTFSSQCDTHETGRADVLCLIGIHLHARAHWGDHIRYRQCPTSVAYSLVHSYWSSIVRSMIFVYILWLK